MIEVYQCQKHGLSEGNACDVCKDRPRSDAWEEDSDTPAKVGGQKFDDAKPMMDLIPPHMEEEVARVLTFGAQKYAPDNWRKVPNLRKRYIAAAKRHINALVKGEQLDPESGLHHAAHAVCCLMFLGEVELESDRAA